ncbi:MAG: enoyl-CoA hydratase-related protein [Bacteroidota bacterium]
MNYQNLLTDFQDGILLVTINRKKALNALNAVTISELNQLFGSDIHELDGLSGVIITGAGFKAFVAGADIKEFDTNAAHMEAIAREGRKAFDAIENTRVPVIAAVNGYALGGGCELAMACHMRIAGEKAKFGQPEVNLGIGPGYAATQRLTRYIGKAKSMELHLTTDMIKAYEALRLGLVNHVVPQGEEVAKAREILKKIATKAPLAVAACIEAINAYYDPEKDGFEIETQYFGSLAETHDFKEGVEAFVEKRKAAFKGK